ncbi:MAG TPA: DoxX family protein [Candidatus Omnitrophota bacterium]|nr:DoxX family protein [Candidatus Omnitrophota bacterium]
MKEKIFFAARVAAGAIFVYSGFEKLLSPYQNFLAVIYGYKVIGGSLAHAAAIIVPWAELLAGLYLVLGLWTRAASGVLWCLNSIFILAITQAIVRKLPIQDCGCFGEASYKIPLQAVLAMDCALWVVYALLFFFSNAAEWMSLDRFFKKRT